MAHALSRCARADPRVVLRCAGDELTTRPPQLHRQSLGCACHRSFPVVPACCREPGGHRLACAGAYAIYRAVAKAAGSMAQDFKTDLTNTEPAVDILPNEAWYDTDKVCRCPSRRRDQCRRACELRLHRSCRLTRGATLCGGSSKTSTRRGAIPALSHDVSLGIRARLVACDEGALQPRYPADDRNHQGSHPNA